MPYVTTLRTIYLHGILLPCVLFMANGSVLMRVFWCNQKQMSTIICSWDISVLVFSDYWLANLSVNTCDIEVSLALLERAFQYNLENWNRPIIYGDTCCKMANTAKSFFFSFSFLFFLVTLQKCGKLMHRLGRICISR